MPYLLPEQQISIFHKLRIFINDNISAAKKYKTYFIKHATVSSEILGMRTLKLISKNWHIKKYITSSILSTF